MRAKNQAAQEKAQPTSVVDGGEEEYVPEAAGTSWMAEEDRPKAELVVPRVFADSDLAEVDSWETAMSFVEGAFGDVVNAADVLGTGFRQADEDDKMRLCGVPLVLMQWMFYAGDFGEDFVAINAIQRHDNGSISKWVIIDGGTGLCQELKSYTKKTGRSGGLGVPKGLRVSKYYIDAETKKALTKAEVAEYMSTKQKMVPAHTFYLDLSA